MNPEEKFEQILDEAISLLQKGKSVSEIVAIFPEHTKELQDLLGVAETLSGVGIDSNQYLPAFESTLAKLPSLASSKQNNVMKQEYFWTKCARWCARPRVIALASASFVLLLVAYAGTNFIRSQRMVAYAPSGDLQSASPVISGSTNVDKSNLLSAQVNRASGLAARDVRSSIPILGRFLEEATIEDTREFLKTDYDLRMRARQVQEVASRIKTIIRGYGGRIDSSSIQRKQARLEFVVPKDTYEDFKHEVLSLVPAQFVEENERSTNLLPQKQEIEADINYRSSTLAELQNNRTNLIAKHKNTVSSLNKQIANLSSRITTLNNQLQLGMQTDEEALKNLQSQINSLYAQRGSLQRRLQDENETHKNGLEYLDGQIDLAGYQLDNAKGKDADLLDNVATVEGSIVIDYISLIELFGIYLRDFWYVVAGILAITFGYRWYRKTRRDDVEPV